MFCRNESIRKYAPSRRKQSAPRGARYSEAIRSPCNARTDFGFPLRERISALASCCKTIDTCLIKMQTRPEGKLGLFCGDGSIRKYAPSRRKQSAPRGARYSEAIRSPCNARTDFGFPLRERISALASCCKTIDTCLIKRRTRPEGKLRSTHEKHINNNARHDPVR